MKLRETQRDPRFRPVGLQPCASQRISIYLNKVAAG